MHPVTLAAPHLASGALVELAPCRRIDVSLYWTVTRLHASALRSLTDAVRRVAAATLVPARNGQALG
jgi:LysR family transcriptional regulator (chromosome initiation inhibitor)